MLRNRGLKRTALIFASIIALSAGCASNNDSNNNNSGKGTSTQQAKGQPRSLQNQNNQKGQSSQGGQNQSQQAKQNKQSKQNAQHNGPLRSLGNQVLVSRTASDEAAKVPGVREANVLIANSKAFVGVIVDTNNGQLSNALEQQIAAAVRRTDNTIQTVYVTSNPEFSDRADRYLNDVENNRIAGGFYEQFKEIVNRIFPNAL